MSPAQLLNEIKARLEVAVWPAAPGAVIFGSAVYVTMGVDKDNLPEVYPFAMIAPGHGAGEEEVVEQWDQEVLIHIGTMVEGDFLGEQALLGGPRSSKGESQGRGVLEVVQAALASVELLTGADGCPVSVQYGAMPDVSPIDGDRNVVSVTSLLRCRVTRQDEFPAPMRLVVAQGAAGHATLTWANPYARFDYRQTVVVRKAGATPPTSITDGTEVYRGTLATFDDACTAGSWSWAAFAVYTYSGIAQDEGVSDALVVGTRRSLVVT